ncbi:hypothetical protein D9757_013464 [Collybiopsis confluens]|uniref:Uncharacterized protein n=1 Tax=Collybiopsis confluens TaxID=2823264 RepID=A0A8H5FUA6_9AGAR|nr:hypothetical protein D9757_013464 [Collybiopsis confluens]
MASTIAHDKGVALVTGSAQGIGKAIAIRLASDGYKVGLNDIASKKELLHALAVEIEQRHGAGSTFVAIADVGDEEEVMAMVKDTVKALGGLDVMVANAGILGQVKPIITLSPEEFDTVLRVNLRGVFLCYKYAAIQMIAQNRGGRIIGASSVTGKQGGELNGPYAASKFAVRGLTQCAALELAEHNITVNAYAPGFIATPMVSNFTGETDPDLTGNRYFKQLPRFAKMGKPEDIASIVSYLASKEAHYITGQSISVNSGIFFD